MEKWQVLILILLEIMIRQMHILMRQVKIFLSTQEEQWQNLLGEPEREQETSFGGGKTQQGRLTDSYVDSLYKELSKHYSRTLDAIHYNNFRHEGRQLYFKGRDEPLTNEDGKLKTFGQLKSILAIQRLRDLGFNMPSGKLTPQQSVILNKTEEELPPTSDTAKAEDIELQEVADNVARSMENLIAQLEGESSEDLPSVTSLA